MHRQQQQRQGQHHIVKKASSSSIVKKASSSSSSLALPPRSLQPPSLSDLEHGIDEDGLSVEHVHVLVRHLAVHQQRQARLAHGLMTHTTGAGTAHVSARWSIGQTWDMHQPS